MICVVLLEESGFIKTIVPEDFKLFKENFALFLSHLSQPELYKMHIYDV